MRGGYGRGGADSRGTDGFANRGRKVATALLRSQFVAGQTTNSARRIQKDLKELQDNMSQLTGVSVAPLPNSIHELCGNLQGPEGTKFQGMVLHFTMTLPTDYPVSPPTIALATPITHPNVFGYSVCLDMLTKPTDKTKIYEGWVPAYTLEAILIQLQSFLFEEEWKNGAFHLLTPETRKQQHKREMEAANAYKNLSHNHKGALEPYPPLPKKRENLNDFIMLKSPKELLLEEYLCFLTKTPLREATLGVGISLKKSVRTTEIKYVNPTMDLISMRAFTKLKIRKALEGEKFSHWLPLYFGENEEFSIESEQFNHDLQEHVKEVKEINLKERFERHFFNSLSFIANGNIKKPITPEQVLAIFPRLITTHIVDLCKENRFASIQAIRRLFNFMRLFNMCIVKYPDVAKIMDEKLKVFIEDPNKRLKDPASCPNLGDIQVFSIMSQTYNFEDIKIPYVDEQLDRQVFWMLQKVPELDFENRKFKNLGKVAEEKRMEVSFETGKVGIQVTTLFCNLNETIQEQTGLISEGRWDQLANALDGNHGCLEMDLENKLQQKIKDLLKMKSYESYFKALNMNIEGGSKGINEKLIQSMKNSRRKGYHADDNIDLGNLKLPTIPDQSQNKALALLGSFMDIKTQDIKSKQDSLQIEENKIDATTSTYSGSVPDGKNAFKMENFVHIQQMLVKDNLNNDEQWKDICANYFPFIAQELSSHKDRTLNAAKLAQMHDDLELFRYETFEQKGNLAQDNLIRQGIGLLNKDIEQAFHKYTLVKDYNEESFTYKKLMIKLTFEELVKNVALNYNFELIYEFIKVFENDLETLKIQLVDTTHLKSNNYYLLAIIPKLKALKIVKFYRDFDSPVFGSNGTKFMKKALTYFKNNNGSLTKFEISNGCGLMSNQDFLYGYLKQMPQLIVLKINNFYIQVKDAKSIGKYLSDHLSVRELDLSQTQLQTAAAKEIADGLMRAKNVEVIKMRKNVSLDSSQIIYNLAFSPKIKHIDLTASCTAVNKWKEIVEALFKLLKISGAIETIMFGQTDISQHLSLDFNMALGESTSIQYVNFDTVNPQNWTSSHQINNLFKAIAMNAYKNGQFKSVSLKNCLKKVRINGLLSSMWISDQDHELWYGDQQEAKKMQKEQLDKNLHCNLIDLDLSDVKFDKDGFNLKAQLEKTDPNWTQLIRFFAQKGLRTLSIPKSDMCYNITHWRTAFGENPVAPCKLQVLNLSSNNIGISGAKSLSMAFEHNNSIEFLDISNNELQVYGTFLLCKSLQKNNTLKGLNLFKNFIDVDGCRALRELLKVNQSIEFLDVGHNRIRTKGLEALAEGINSSETCKLKTLGLRWNFLIDDSIKKFFDDVVFSNVGQLENLYIKFNNITQGKIIDLKAQLDSARSLLYVDEFEKVVHLTDEQRKTRTLFFKFNSNVVTGAQIKSTVFMFKHYLPQVGLVKNFYFKRGHSIRKKTYQNTYFYVEFEDEKSVMKCQKLLTRSNVIGATPYQVGSNTFVNIRRSVKTLKVRKNKKTSRRRR